MTQRIRRTRLAFSSFAFIQAIMLLLAIPSRAVAFVALVPPDDDTPPPRDRADAPPSDDDDDFGPDEPRDRPLAGPRGPRRMGDDGPRGDRPRRFAPDDEGGRRRPFMDRDGAIPPEMIDRWMERLAERLPEKHKRLAELREQDPKRFNRFVQQIRPLIEEYLEWVHEQRPEVADTLFDEFDAEQALHRLARQYHETTDDAARADLIAKMETQIRAQFDAKRKRMKARLEFFAERIRRQQEELARRQKEFDESADRVDDFVAERIADIKEGRLEPPPPHRRPGESRRRGMRGRDHGPHDDDAPRPPPPGPGPDAPKR